MNILKLNRYWIIYGSIFCTVLLISYLTSGFFVKLNITEFIGDVLNFSSIMTGFLGAMLGILASISKSTSIMKSIFETKQAKLQLIVSVIIPFLSGMTNIVICSLFRLMLNNQIKINCMPFLFIATTIFFLISSILMIVMIFALYFHEDNKQDRKKKVQKIRAN
ncbi:TPA: hypothetical protein ACSEJ5_001562 [Streptococcus pyogenes]|uniref:hypothetical protein n=1 Tax=Streptococcus pyogenes TaxID=1314 RepID=UPI00109C245B|nr:hypothetical protein [Streptococcus pyogenes]VGV38706.1 Uncharacterised protein [Streptococcus pyogenes]VHA87714.1 Uncharacterised protein [Streptococcus pyogenes]VHA88495.1 Uncharacterised protein [Streptococcus pyogenes]VHC59523.1 Uncharacterised protein [Streptococcus pyogenes]VHD23081.1 Uncharacterised protein [Streptococcus pyogenes]